MTDIQRWTVVTTLHSVEHKEGEYVLYADHMEALRQAEERAADAAWDRCYEMMQRAGDIRARIAAEQGQRDALAAAVQRVEALPPHFGSYAGWLMAHEVIAAIQGADA